MANGCIAYIVTVDRKDYLCVLADGEHHRYGPLEQGTLARLNVECAERLLVNIQGAYATRINAPPLTSTPEE